MATRRPRRTGPDDEPLVRIAARRAVRSIRRDAETPQFGRLMAYQAAGAAGDALLALALAGSLFFSVPTAEARGRVALYLLLTVAPFAVVSPLLARFVDRGRGRLRIVMITAAAGRAVLAFLLSSRLDSALLFPIAFGVLILSRAALIVRGAVLPQLVPPGRTLVGANAALTKTGALAGMVVGLPGAALLKWPGVQTELLLCAGVYALGLVPVLGLPKLRGRRALDEQIEARSTARSVSIRQGLVVTAGMRFLVGFLVFHLAFAFRREDIGVLGLGLLVGVAATGGLFGALLAARLRRRLKEEGILVFSLALSGIVAMFVGRWFSLFNAGALVLAFGMSSGAVKVAFDAIVQRETVEAARGWAFARFESVLQLAWVLGGLIPVVLAIAAGPGVFVAGVVGNLLAILYTAGRHRVRSAAIP
ncbi:MAG TPA: MFS transporter [Actinomycetota bacterium]|nr:MFS transporter [Actinomycetota bacterium]